MAVVDFPDGIFPQLNTGGYCHPVSIVDVMASSRTGKQQAVMRGAGELWKQEVTIITSGTKEETLAKCLADVRGRYNQLRCPDLIYRGQEVDADGNYKPTGSFELFSDSARFDDGGGFKADTAPTVTLNGGHAQGVTRLIVNINQSDPDTVPVGSRVQVGDNLYAVTAWDWSLSRIDIHPPLRETASTGSTVTTVNAKGLWRLVANEDVTPEHVQGSIKVRTLTMIEDF